MTDVSIRQAAPGDAPAIHALILELAEYERLTTLCTGSTAELADALFGERAVASIAVARRCGRFEWSVLDWNAPAIGFYERLGATVMPDWRIVRVTGDALAQLGRPAAD